MNADQLLEQIAIYEANRREIESDPEHRHSLKAGDWALLWERTYDSLTIKFVKIGGTSRSRIMTADQEIFHMMGGYQVSKDRKVRLQLLAANGCQLRQENMPGANNARIAVYLAKQQIERIQARSKEDWSFITKKLAKLSPKQLSAVLSVVDSYEV